MPAAPSEFPPPFDPGDYVVAPSDPEAIEVGVAIVGGGPGRPRLRDQGHAAPRGRAGADREPRGGPRGGDREGQGRGRAPAVGGEHAPLGAPGAVPRPRPVGVARLRRGDQGRRLPAHLEAGGAVEAAAAELPESRQLRDLDLEARAVPRREGRGSRRLPADRDRRRAPARLRPDRQGGALRGQGARPRRGRARELRAGLRRDRQGHGPGRGHAGPPDRRGDRLLRASRAFSHSAGSSA